MLNHSIFTYFLSLGQQQAGMRDISGALPGDVSFCAGVPFSGGRALHSLSLPITHYHNALPFCGNSALATEQAPAVRFSPGALGITANGRLAIAIGAVATHYSRGFPMTDFGQICVPPEGPPLNDHAFSLGFDQGAFA